MRRICNKFERGSIVSRLLIIPCNNNHFKRDYPQTTKFLNQQAYYNETLRSTTTTNVLSTTTATYLYSTSTSTTTER